jgi:nicotinamide-nucleotide amidase
LRFAIISIGTELNLGLILNTNSKYIAESLAELGLECNYMFTVRDNEDDIADVVNEGLKRSDILILSGGLGPTDDDITRDAVARALNLKLVRDPDLDDTSLGFVKRINDGEIAENLKESLLKQSLIPEGAISIKPRIGSAAGFIVKLNNKKENEQNKWKENKWLFSIPGVPKEMKDMFDFDVLPYLKNILNSVKESNRRKSKREYGSEQNLFIKKAEILTTDISESETELKIKDIKTIAKNLNVEIGITATPGLIKLILISKSRNLSIGSKNLSLIEDKIRDIMGDYVYGAGSLSMGDNLKEIIDKKGRKITISAAESITGGLISSIITDTPGSSDFFLGSIISYSDLVKSKVLGIDKNLINEKGAVSSEVCLNMALGAKNIFNSDFAIGVTGIAGPSSPEKNKQVGLVYCAVVGPNNYKELFEKNFIGSRTEIKFRTAQFILNRLRVAIKRL